MLGQSIAVDFLLHVGLGVAAASTFLVALLKPTFHRANAAAPWMSNLLNTMIGVVLIGSQIAIVAFMAAVKNTTASDASPLGYVLGIVGTLAIVWLIRPKQADAG